MIKIEISDDGESKIEIKCKDELELFKNLERLHCEIVNFSASNIKDYLDVARNALAKSANQFAFFQTRAMTGYDDLLTRFTDYGALVESEFRRKGK